MSSQAVADPPTYRSKSSEEKNIEKEMRELRKKLKKLKQNKQEKQTNVFENIKKAAKEKGKILGIKDPNSPSNKDLKLRVRKSEMV